MRLKNISFSLIYSFIGFVTLLSGIWMLVDPMSWYIGLPAAVPDTGPFNAHFIKDLGIVASLVGIGAFWCAYNLDRCKPIHIVITLYFIGHALVHVLDIASGYLPMNHWLIDLPAVFGTVLILIGLTPFIMRQSKGSDLKRRELEKL